MLPQATDARARKHIGRYLIKGRIGRGDLIRRLDEFHLVVHAPSGIFDTYGKIQVGDEAQDQRAIIGKAHG